MTQQSGFFPKEEATYRQTMGSQLADEDASGALEGAGDPMLHMLVSARSRGLNIKISIPAQQNPISELMKCATPATT